MGSSTPSRASATGDSRETAAGRTRDLSRTQRSGQAGDIIVWELHEAGEPQEHQETGEEVLHL